MKPRHRQCFNEGLLQDLRAYIDSFTKNGGVIHHGVESHKVRYGVLASKVPGVFIRRGS